MKAWVVRIASLLVFNIVLLLVIGWFTPARVGWAALWAGVILTAATIWIKPLIESVFRSLSARRGTSRSWLAEKGVQLLIALGVAAIVWVLVVVFSGVSVGGWAWFWGWVMPPVFLAVGWQIYAAIDSLVEIRAAAMYDRVERGLGR